MLTIGQVVSGTELGGWLFCLLVVMMLINQAMKMSRSVRGTPPAGELDVRVKVVEGAVQRSEQEIRRVDGKVDQLQKDIVTNGDKRKSEMLSHIDRKHNELREEISSMREGTQDQLNVLIEKVGELKGKVS
jgi:hypothetical protein